MLFILSGCETPMMLLNHNPEVIIKKKLDNSINENDFQKKIFVLRMVNDLSKAPTGAYLNDHYFFVNPVNQTYLLSQPGFVLFEKIADALKKQNAIVYRQYNQQEINSDLKYHACIVTLSVKDMEVHLWERKKEGTFYLAKAHALLSIHLPSGEHISSEDSVSAKVNESDDVFDVLANKFCDIIKTKI